MDRKRTVAGAAKPQAVPKAPRGRPPGAAGPYAARKPRADLAPAVEAGPPAAPSPPAAPPAPSLSIFGPPQIDSNASDMAPVGVKGFNWGRPANNMGLPDSNVSCLFPVVDTLHLCFEVRLTSAFLAVESENPNRQVPAQPLEQFDQRKGTLKGYTGYTWIGLGKGALEGVNVMWGPAQDPSQYPERRRVRVMIGSAQCWRARAAGARADRLAYGVLDALMGPMLAQFPAPEAVAIRRIDVAIDHWGYAWTKADLDQFVTRAKCRGLVEEGERLDPDRREFVGPETATYYVGSRGAAARMLRVYNKVAEAAASGKLEWMERAWRVGGWDGASTVWRAEIEHGGQWLHDHGFKDLTCLRGCERTLWQHYQGTVRHVRCGRKRMDRRRTSDVWRALAAAVETEPPSGKECPSCNGVGTQWEDIRSLIIGQTEIGQAWTPSCFCITCRGVGQLPCWEWVPRAPSKGADVEQLLAQAAGCLEAACKAVRAGFLLPMGAGGQLTGLAGSEDDRDGELLALLHEYVKAKRLREAEKEGKPAL